ncbi:hypothetical protein DEA98_25855 [Brucella pseudogrignonensis]|nr:hypothetical protein [Brucella pseudogrignonensis]
MGLRNLMEMMAEPGILVIGKRSRNENGIGMRTAVKEGWRSSVAQNEMDHQKEDDEPDGSGGENN